MLHTYLPAGQTQQNDHPCLVLSHWLAYHCCSGQHVPCFHWELQKGYGHGVLVYQVGHDRMKLCTRDLSNMNEGTVYHLNPWNDRKELQVLGIGRGDWFYLIIFDSLGTWAARITGWERVLVVDMQVFQLPKKYNEGLLHWTEMHKLAIWGGKSDCKLAEWCHDLLGMMDRPS